MIKTTQKNLKALVKNGMAVDLTYAEKAPEEHITKIAVSIGVYGCNGALYSGNDSGRLYAVCGRTSALFMLPM